MKAEVNSSKEKYSRKKFKILIIGNDKNIKKSFLNKLTNRSRNSSANSNSFSETTHDSENNSLFVTKNIEYNNKIYIINYFDFIEVNKIGFLGESLQAHGCIYINSTIDDKNMNQFKKGIDDSRRFLDGEILPSIFLLPNYKMDISDVEKIDGEESGNDNKKEEEISKFIRDNGYLKYFDVNLLSGNGIKEANEFLINEIIKKVSALSKEKPELFDNDKDEDEDSEEQMNKIQDKKRGFCSLCIVN